MDKTEIKAYIIQNYSSMLSIILLTQVDNLKSGKFYGFMQGDRKMKLSNDNGNYSLKEVL